MVQDIEHTDVPVAPSSDASWRSDVLRRLRLEEFLFLVMFIPSMIVTIWANFDLYAEGIRSRRIRGGILRLAIVAALGAVLPLLDRWRRHLSPSVGRSTIEFFRTFLPFALCSAVYTNLHDTVRWINPNDIHDRLMVIEEWMFGFQPVVWAEQFITPERTGFFSFLYANFFVLTIVVSCVLWALGRRRDARETMLGIIVCFYSGYVLYVVFPAAPPRLYFESLGMFSVDLSGGPITDFQNALLNMMPNQASRAAFPSLHSAVSLLAICYAWRFCRWLVPLLALLVAGLLVATVYLRHHYIIDLIAGAALVPWALWVTPRLDRWWRGDSEPLDLGRGVGAKDPALMASYETKTTHIRGRLRPRPLTGGLSHRNRAPWGGWVRVLSTQSTAGDHSLVAQGADDWSNHRNPKADMSQSSNMRHGEGVTPYNRF